MRVKEGRSLGHITGPQPPAGEQVAGLLLRDPGLNPCFSNDHVFTKCVSGCARSFSLLPLWSSYEGFLFYHLTMGIALSMISGGDVALLYDSYLAAGGEKSGGTVVLGNAKLAAQTGTTVSALLGGAVVTLSYGHLLWANAILSWIPVLLVLRLTEPPAAADRGRSGRTRSRRFSRARRSRTPRLGSCSSTRSPGGPAGW